jgi:hypothetical protein
MITIWRLYVLKHIVERSTHMCSGVTPEHGQVTPPRHTSPSYLQIKDAFYTVFVARCLCRLSPRTPFSHIHHTLKGKHILSTIAMIYKYMCSHSSPIYLHLVVSSTSWYDRQGIMRRYIHCMYHRCNPQVWQTIKSQHKSRYITNIIL